MPGPDTVGGLIMQKAVVSLIDDLDGSEAEVTVTFGYQGQEYEIDLNNTHAAEMRDKLGSYAAHARRVRAQRPGHTPARTAAPIRASRMSSDEPRRSRKNSQRATNEATIAMPMESASKTGSYVIIGVIWIAAMPT